MSALPIAAVDSQTVISSVPHKQFATPQSAVFTRKLDYHNLGLYAAEN